jgi:hypothetical protein
VRLQDVATVEVRTKPLRWDVVGIAAAALWVVTFVITYAADSDDSETDRFSGADRWDALGNATVLAVAAAVVALVVQRALAARSSPVLAVLTHGNTNAQATVFSLGGTSAADIEAAVRGAQEQSRF